MSNINVSPSSVSINNLNLENNKTFNIKYNYYEDNDVPDYNQVLGYSNTNFSDYDNIHIHQLKDIMQDLKNEFDDVDNDYYYIYCRYIEGKKLNEIYDNNNALNLINDKKLLQEILKEHNINKDIDLVYNEMNQIIQDNRYKIGSISDDLLNSTIIEVHNTDNEYNAMVLKNNYGNYMIVNCCTNAEEAKDLLAIAYTMSKYITGSDDLLKYIASNILLNENMTSASKVELARLLTEDIDYCKTMYQAQLNDNINLINKYIDITKKENGKVELYGYSLGGGIQETAYAHIYQNNPEIEKYIESVTVYNPFSLYCQEYNDSAIDTLVNNDKVLIYSLQEDFVSTFNDSVEVLLPNTIYLDGDDIKEDSVSSFSDLYKLVIGSKGNHGFSHINDDCFESTSGNLISTGEFVNINHTLEVSGNVTSDLSTDDKDKYLPDYENIINNMLSIANVKTSIKETLNNIGIFNEEVLSDSIDESFINISEYLNNNFGNYDYDSLMLVISYELWNIIDTNKNSLKINYWTEVFVDIFMEISDLDKDNFIRTMHTILTDESMKQKVYDYIGLISQNNTIEANKILNDIIDCSIEQFTICSGNNYLEEAYYNIKNSIGKSGAVKFGAYSDIIIDSLGENANQITDKAGFFLQDKGQDAGKATKNFFDNLGDDLKENTGSNFVTNGIDSFLNGTGFVLDKTFDWGGTLIGGSVAVVGDGADFLLDFTGDVFNTGANLVDKFLGLF